MEPQDSSSFLYTGNGAHGCTIYSMYNLSESFIFKISVNSAIDWRQCQMTKEDQMRKYTEILMQYMINAGCAFSFSML